MNVTINWQTIITVASVITAVVFIVKSFRKVNSYAEKPNKNEEAIKELYSMVDEQRKVDEALSSGVQALLRAEIVSSYNHYFVNKKYAPIYAKENMEHLRESYKALGGNGVVEDMYNKFMTLPTEKENEEEN